jgi:hypothetical protein
MIVQVKNVKAVGSEANAIDVPTTASEGLDSDTLAWRKEFIGAVRSWTADEIAEQSTSKATNKSAIASRWQSEGKIFSVRFEGRNLFPRFQFKDGSPIPVVAKVIQLMPEHMSGWDFAFFFYNPNSYIGGRRPFEMIRSNPGRVLSLAKQFAHPADVF